MSKLSQILAVGVMTLTPLVTSSGAFALGTCAIGYTGPDSNNQCISETSFTCSVVNNTKVEVTNTNTQSAVSGDAVTTVNTTGGSSNTGSATNANGVTFTATVTNPVVDNQGGTCTVVASVPATNPVGGGGGAAGGIAQAISAPAGGKGAVAVLPNTSGDPVMAYVAGLVGIFGAAAVASRLAVMAYGRIKS